MDFHGDHTSTCTAHSGATKAHDWMVSVLGPLFRTAGHTVRTQHGVTASAGQLLCDVEIQNYLLSQGSVAARPGPAPAVTVAEAAPRTPWAGPRPRDGPPRTVPPRGGGPKSRTCVQFLT